MPCVNRFWPHFRFLISCLLFVNVACQLSRPQIPPSQVPEKDLQREFWRLNVEPYKSLGNAKPGSDPEDIDDPDGLAFDLKGYLLITDANNFRVQVWDVHSGQKIGEFGSKKIFDPKGEIVDIAVGPDGLVIVTDEKAKIAYPFKPSPRGPGQYDYLGAPIFAGEGFGKVGGIAIDAKSNIYTVDGELNEVRRYDSNYKLDKTWVFEKFTKKREPLLRNPEGVAIDDARNILYVASEFGYVVQLFDLQTGKYLKKLVGARLDMTDYSIKGKKIFTGTPALFTGSPEGVGLLHGYLFAVDELAGHVHIFDTQNEQIFNHDIVDFIQLAKKDRFASGYIGFVGHSPNVSLEDRRYRDLIRKRKINPSLSNAPNSLCSPDSVVTYFDTKMNEGFIAVADQCNYRIVVYRWSDIVKAASLKHW